MKIQQSKRPGPPTASRRVPPSRAEGGQSFLVAGFSFSPHGGKCIIFAEKPGTFPGGGNGKCGERGLWSQYPCRPRGKVNRFRRKTRHFPRGWKWQVLRERSVEPVPHPAAGESEPFSRKNPALSPGVEMPSAAREACGAGTHASHKGKVNHFREKVRHFPP